jgi:hypothetical protein
MATYSNIFVDQGSDFAMVVDLTQTVGTLNLTGYSARGQIKKTYSSSSSVSFVASVDTTNTELDISLAAAVTGAMKAGRYVYDIEILDGNSPAGVTRVLEGQLEVTPRVTTG